jgi:hypothetical protein
LLTSWLAAQLRMTQPRADGGGYAFAHPNGQSVKVELRPEAAARSAFASSPTEQTRSGVHRDQQGDFFRVEVRLSDGQVYNHLLPAGSNSTTALLLWEIGGGSRHKIYNNAVSIIDQLL